MSKTLEELGYEKKNAGTPKVKVCMFEKEIKIGKRKLFEAFTFIYPEKYITIKNKQILTMEELKAIYKYCEDNKWI